MPARQWTRQELQNLGEHGFFEGRRATLIRGVIFEEGRISPLHATATSLVYKTLSAAFGPDFDVRPRLPLAYSIDTEPSPDMAVVRGEPGDYVAEHPTPADTVLVLEIADVSPEYDLTTKAELYAEAGIAEYWVLDVLNGRLTVLRSPAPLPPGGHAYQSTTTHQPTDSVAPLAAPTALVLVSELLP